MQCFGIADAAPSAMRHLILRQTKAPGGAKSAAFVAIMQ
jgi:hypothetical protein